MHFALIPGVPEDDAVTFGRIAIGDEIVKKAIVTLIVCSFRPCYLFLSEA